MTIDTRFTESNHNFTRLIFIVRMSAIGDVIIAAKTVQHFLQRNYSPVFVSSVRVKDILLKIKDLKLFICLDDNYKPEYYVNGLPVGLSVFKKYCYLDKFDFCPIYCDLHRTTRSHSAIKILNSELCNRRKKIVYKVEKKILYRFLLIFVAYLSVGQKKRQSKNNTIKRIHDTQLELINKIFKKDNKPQVIKNNDIFLIKDQNASTKKYVCIFPGSSGSIKNWPKEHFKTLIELILSRTDYDVYICGDKNDIVFLQFIETSGGFPESQRIHDKIGKCTLAQTLNLIAHASYVVCNDSFASHAADAYQIPATVIFGSTTPKFGFAPESSSIKIQYLNLSCSPCTRHGKGACRYGNLKCLKEIHPANIIEDFCS